MQPLGERYALVAVSDDRSADVDQQIRQQDYVAETLSVLMPNDAEPATLVLPNGIITSFDRNLSNTHIQTLLNRYRLEVILHFGLRKIAIW